MNEKFDLKKPQHLIALFLVLFVLLTIPLTVISVFSRLDNRSQAANTTALSLSPASQSINVNTDFTVQVRENSGTTAVTTADITLTYDTTKVAYFGVDPTVATDPFNKDAALAPPSGDSSGTISFTKFVEQIDGSPPRSVTGDKLIATVHFRTKTVAGVTPVNFSATSTVYGVTGTDETSTRTGGSYTVVDIPPTVSMTAPANGAFVKGTITLSADATDNLGVTRVEFYDGATLVGTDTTATGTSYSVPWNTTTATAGSHSLTAKAFDVNGSTTSAPPRNVTVDNTAPSAVTIAGLAPKVKGSVTVTGTATDANLDRIEFKVDSGSTTTDNTSPYTYDINTNLLSNASHTLTATAYDKAGTAGTATNQTFIVDNLPPSTPVLSGTAISETEIDLSWTAGTDTQSGPVVYDVYRNGSKITPTPLSTTTLPVTGLLSATSYNFVTKAIDTMGNSVDSNTLVISTKNPPKEGDINGDDLVNSADLAILLSTWGSTTDLRADINNDGRVSSADLAKLISRWGS